MDDTQTEKVFTRREILKGAARTGAALGVGMVAGGVLDKFFLTSVAKEGEVRGEIDSPIAKFIAPTQEKVKTGKPGDYEVFTFGVVEKPTISEVTFTSSKKYTAPYVLGDINDGLVTLRRGVREIDIYDLEADGLSNPFSLSVRAGIEGAYSPFGNSGEELELKPDAIKANHAAFVFGDSAEETTFQTGEEFSSHMVEVNYKGVRVRGAMWGVLTDGSGNFVNPNNETLKQGEKPYYFNPAFIGSIK